MYSRYLPTFAAMQCFESAARHLSFTRAAEELNLTQSAVSKQVAQLESILEHNLFTRIRRRLHLTAEGVLYLAEVRKVLSQVEMSTRYMQAYGGENEVLNVSTLPTFGARWLLPRLNGFRLQHPRVFLNIANCSEPFDLEQESVDVAFFYGHGRWPKAACTKLRDEAVVPVCSPDIVNVAELESPKQLTKLVLLQLSSRPEQWHDWFAAQNLYTSHSYYGPRFDSFDMILRAARSGCGVALVPRFLAQEELSEGKLVVPWDYEIAGTGAYYMAVPEHKTGLPKVQYFRDWVLERAPIENSLALSGWSGQ
ncbi:MAG: transcriptional regulator GcvA [Natronospirillum sp.]